MLLSCLNPANAMRRESNKWHCISMHGRERCLPSATCDRQGHHVQKHARKIAARRRHHVRRNRGRDGYECICRRMRHRSNSPTSLVQVEAGTKGAREGRRESSSPLTTFTVHASSSNVIRINICIYVRSLLVALVIMLFLIM